MGPRVLALNQPAEARTKAISWGPPPCSSIRKGGPVYGWKSRGIFAVVGTGPSGLRLCRYVGELLEHQAEVSKSHGGRGPLIEGCRCPAGVKGWRGHSPGDRVCLALREFPGKSPPRPWSPSLSCAQCLCGVGVLLGNVAPVPSIAWGVPTPSLDPRRTPTSRDKRPSASIGLGGMGEGCEQMAYVRADP